MWKSLPGLSVYKLRVWWLFLFGFFQMAVCFVGGDWHGGRYADWTTRGWRHVDNTRARDECDDSETSLTDEWVSTMVSTPFNPNIRNSIFWRCYNTSTSLSYGRVKVYGSYHTPTNAFNWPRLTSSLRVLTFWRGMCKSNNSLSKSNIHMTQLSLSLTLHKGNICDE